MATDTQIDDSLYSRQRYVLGDNAMQRLAKSSVLLYGLGGLGVEIAKNIVLAGIKSLAIQDEKAATLSDLGTQFFLREQDVQTGRNRAEASADHLGELNPYVSLKTLSTGIEENTDLSYLLDFQCVIMTEAPLEVLLRVNQFCRTQNPPINFICGDVYGVFCSAFCDFGVEFEVVDKNGEELKETFIGKITKASPGVVACLENHMHGFEKGDTVIFREIIGMDFLDGKQCIIDVLSPDSFSICDTTRKDFSTYLHGGIATQIKVPVIVHFQSLEQQIKTPDMLYPDLSKTENPLFIHVGYIAVKRFQEKHGRLPHIRCSTDAEQLLSIASEVNDTLQHPINNMKFAQPLLQQLSFSCQGSFAPLCAMLGGILAQETLKSLTGKFTPLSQWFHLDAIEVIGEGENHSFQQKGDRYDALRACIGDEICQKLAGLHLFMVGCGAIGCEMLKNYALLGIGTEADGLVTITDHDLIEKSNLNRQFLFRPDHIRLPKSATAAKAVKEINPNMHIEAQQYKVCPQTESTVYTDQFFEAQNILVNALDNIEARRYMDSRCVTTQRPLLESGTLGAKAHVQVILPHLTESYASQSDPHDEDIPYCTLKSFPASIEHCIQWARDKFESSFSQKPNLVNKFWSSNPNPQEMIEKLRSGISPEGAVQVSKVLKSRPRDWNSCVQLARLKLEKYYNHKAEQLLHVFPLDTKLTDGSLFWQSPKRRPVPAKFDPTDELDLSFIVSTARMYAGIGGIPYSSQDLSPDRLNSILCSMSVPDFRPSNKKIITDETVSKDDAPPELDSGDELVDVANRFQTLLSSEKAVSFQTRMNPAMFEKDDDSNAHIDFITAASNLRARMYKIEPSDRLKTKKIAGRIVPAIATTTAAVAGLVTIELLKVVRKCGLEKYRNCFLNLGLPVMLLSEPGPVERSNIREGLTYTIWDRWEVKGDKNFTLEQFLHYFKEKSGLEMTSVVMGVKMIYISIMPRHKKRLPQTMLKLLKPGPAQKYADLVVLMEGHGEDDVAGPPVRYYFGS